MKKSRIPKTSHLAPLSQKSLKYVILPLGNNNWQIFAVSKRNCVSFVIYICHHFICILPAWNKNLKCFSSLQIRQKINYNNISSLFIAPARPKTKPTPIYDATGRLLVTSTTITIRMPICYYNDNHGPIKNVQVLVAEAGGIIKC